MITFDSKLAPATVIGNAERLRTIVDNLLSNAIKYSPRNATIELAVSVSGGCAVLDVIDGGRGVAPSDRARIFDSFYQGPPPVDGRVKGSGLGLAIARDIVRGHGGDIALDVSSMGGLRAIIRVPL